MLISKFTTYQENANINSADKLRRREQNRKKQTWKTINKNAEQHSIDVNKNLGSPTRTSVDEVRELK